MGGAGHPGESPWALAKKLTPTCVVPSAILNAAWVGTGTMSRTLTLERREQKILFLE
jgi:hypothetical protein